MTTRLRARKQRSASLNNWLWWTPVLAVPFAVALYEIYLVTQMRLNDYTAGEVNAEIRQMEMDIEGLRVERARLERLDHLEVAAPNLGLVVPSSNQVRMIYYDASRNVVVAPDSLPGLQYAAAPQGASPLPMLPIPGETPLPAEAAAPADEAAPALAYPGGGMAIPMTRHATMPAATGSGAQTTSEPLDDSVGHLLGVL
jgi:hypothetical protein